VLAEEGQAAYEIQAEALRKAKPEVLPKLQIWKGCTELDRCLRSALRDMRGADEPGKKSNREDVLKVNADADGLGGDDALESARNGLYAFKEIETTMPKGHFVAQRIEEFQADFEKDFGERLTDPTRLMMVMQTQAAQYQKIVKPQPASFNLPSSRNIRRRFQ